MTGQMKQKQQQKLASNPPFAVLTSIALSITLFISVFDIVVAKVWHKKASLLSFQLTLFESHRGKNLLFRL